jgi:hypothetical protein
LKRGQRWALRLEIELIYAGIEQRFPLLRARILRVCERASTAAERRFEVDAGTVAGAYRE